MCELPKASARRHARSQRRRDDRAGGGPDEARALARIEGAGALDASQQRAHPHLAQHPAAAEHEHLRRAHLRALAAHGRAPRAGASAGARSPASAAAPSAAAAASTNTAG